MIRLRLDANYQDCIQSCSACSAHEDRNDPPECLVCDGQIDMESLNHGYPGWCPLSTMAVIDPDAEIRSECSECDAKSIKKVKVGSTFKYSVCRVCGIRYFVRIPDL